MTGTRVTHTGLPVALQGSARHIIAVGSKSLRRVILVGRRVKCEWPLGVEAVRGRVVVGYGIIAVQGLKLERMGWRSIGVRLRIVIGVLGWSILLSRVRCRMQRQLLRRPQTLCMII